jgi:hypothetical protein
MLGNQLADSFGAQHEVADAISLEDGKLFTPSRPTYRQADFQQAKDSVLCRFQQRFHLEHMSRNGPWIAQIAR